jgi:hypothetical protein
MADALADLRRDLKADIKQELDANKKELKQELDANKQELKQELDDSKRAVSTEVYAKINAGAMFAVLGGPKDSGAPLMCGTFVSETVALTAAHDDSIKAAIKKRGRGPIFGRTVPPPGAPPDSAINLTFIVASADFDLDFAVLRLVSPATAPAFIPLPPIGHVPVGNVSAGLVTLSIGSSRVLSPTSPSTPTVAAFLVQISSVTAHHYHYSASTWSGDSGGALVVHSGFLMGLHVEVLSEYDAPKRGSADPGVGKGKERGPDSVSHDEFVDHLTSVSSSHGREAIALIVSLSAVRDAVAAAAQ